MTWLTNLEPRDRRMLIVCTAIVSSMIVLLAVFAPAQGADDPVPSSFGTGNHGAKAAYLTLARLGYKIQRWNDSLDLLANSADAHSTLILAAPYPDDPIAQRAAIKAFLDRGGRIVAAGASAVMLLPDASSAPILGSLSQDCSAVAVGFDNEAAALDVHIRRVAYWSDPRPGVRTQYICDGKAVVVTYKEGKGEVVWWGDTLPLENSGISMGGNLELLLRSIGPAKTTRVYWDELLSGEPPSTWSKASGTPIYIAAAQASLVAALMFLSYGRRNGPLRPDPLVSRASPIEFVYSLGGLFHKAHTSNAAVAIAYQRMRRVLQLKFGILSSASAADAAQVLNKRLGDDAGTLATSLKQAEAVSRGEEIHEGKALTLVQVLHQQETKLNRERNQTATEG